MYVLEVEITILEGLERIRASWMWAGGNFAVSRFGEMIVDDKGLPRGFIEELLHPNSRRKILVANAPEAETRCGESFGVDEGIALIGKSVEVRQVTRTVALPVIQAREPLAFRAQEAEFCERSRRTT